MVSRKRQVDFGVWARAGDEARFTAWLKDLPLDIFNIKFPEAAGHYESSIASICFE